MPAKRYSWDDWFARPQFRLRRGEDYGCSQSSMYQQILSAASARGVRVTVVDDSTGFTVTLKTSGARQPRKTTAGQV